MATFPEHRSAQRERRSENLFTLMIALQSATLTLVLVWLFILYFRRPAPAACLTDSTHPAPINIDRASSARPILNEFVVVRT